MYSLVALGFVLIYKASGVFNFAQGAMVLFAALTFVGLHGQVRRAALARRSLLTLVRHGRCSASLIERLVLRPLVNQPQITLFMATIGLAFFLEGFGAADLGQRGAHARPRHRGRADRLPDGALQHADHRSSTWSPPLCAGCWSRRWPCSFSRPRIGRALRAVADDHQAALSVGIPLKQIWAIVWSVAGFVALVAGMMWGAQQRRAVRADLVALKALPVLILGGFTSMPGAIVGGLIIGAGEKLAEVYLGPACRRRHRRLVRLRAGAAVPAGPAGRPVRREDHRAGRSRGVTACSTAKPASSRPATPPTSRCSRSCRIGSASLAAAAGRLRRRAAAGQRLLVVGDPDAVPGLRAGGDRA